MGLRVRVYIGKAIGDLASGVCARFTVFADFRGFGTNRRALIVRIGFWVRLYNNYNEEPPREVRGCCVAALLGGSLVVIIISRLISRVTMLITHIRGLITLHITTHEPSSWLRTSSTIQRIATH